MSARYCCITISCDASCHSTRHLSLVSERVYTPNHGRALQSQADLRLPVDGEPWWRWQGLNQAAIHDTQIRSIEQENDEELGWKQNPRGLEARGRNPVVPSYDCISVINPQFLQLCFKLQSQRRHQKSTNRLKVFWLCEGKCQHWVGNNRFKIMRCWFWLADSSLNHTNIPFETKKCPLSQDTA